MGGNGGFAAEDGVAAADQGGNRGQCGSGGGGEGGVNGGATAMARASVSQPTRRVACGFARATSSNDYNTQRIITVTQRDRPQTRHHIQGQRQAQDH